MKVQKNLLQSRGFTIVELLIVIVVVGILAAITIVAYNGVQQRANNTAIINAASETVKAIRSYYALEGDIPSRGDACVSIETGCVNANGMVYTNALSFGGSGVIAPKSVPKSGDISYGIRYNASSGRLFNGEEVLIALVYYLQGRDRQCGLNNVMDSWGTGGVSAVTSTRGYSSYTSDGKTVCYIAVPLG